MHDDVGLRLLAATMIRLKDLHEEGMGIEGKLQNRPLEVVSMSKVNVRYQWIARLGRTGMMISYWDL